jgi:Flp pilus assembly protein TadG
MRTNSKAGKLLRHKKSGQAIPLIALMIVILVAMVGLSVDVGNTYAEERQAVAASNAASIAGMDVVIKNGRNGQVRDAIVSSLESNGMALGDANGEVQWTAEYLDNKGTKLADVTADSNNPPDNVSYIKVTLDGKVDTFFARVVNRDTLPIDADSYAGVCPPTSNVFPLAVDKTLIDFDGEDFLDAPVSPGEDPESGKLDGREYLYKTWRRVYDLTDTGNPGGFSWLKWLPNKPGSNGADYFQDSWIGDGNIDQGFEEASQPSGYAFKIDPYPSRPGQINASDWVHGLAGNRHNADDVIDEKISTGQRLILPIVDATAGQGNKESDPLRYHVAALGVFVIIDRGNIPGRGEHFDMVYLGPPDAFSSACGAAPPNVPGTLDLEVPVEPWPVYEEIKKSQPPLQYVVVLDVSGSMSANFSGQCKQSNGKIIQCINATGMPPATQSPNVNIVWTPLEERRIYVAKDAIRHLIDKMNIPGNTGYDAARPSDEMSITWYNREVKADWASAWSNQKAQLYSAVDGATPIAGKPYVTDGATNGAAGLYKASTLLSNKPKTATLNGKTWDYKRVVIFVTDGVSNQFFKASGTFYDGESHNRTPGNTYAPGNICYDAKLVTDRADCQTTAVGGKYGTKDRPITQMVNNANTYLKNNAALGTKIGNPDIFVIALSDIPNTGLRDGVASQTDYYFQAKKLERYADGTTNVDNFVNQIHSKVVLEPCQAEADNKWAKYVSPQNAPEGTRFTYPQVGLAKLTNDTGYEATAPIIADTTTGRAKASFTGLVPGTYQLTIVEFWYKHEKDGITRMYNDIYSADDTSDFVTINVDESNPNGNLAGTIEELVQVKLTDGAAVCAEAPPVDK